MCRFFLNTEITGLKRDYLLKTGQKAYRSKFVGTRRHDAQKRDNIALNRIHGQ